MRKLNTHDVFAAARVIRASGARAELVSLIKDITAKEKESIDLEDIGLTGFLTIIECAGERKAESAVYELLADIFETKAEDVEKMELPDLMEKLKQINEENNLKSFFKFASAMSTKK